MGKREHVAKYINEYWIRPTLKPKGYENVEKDVIGEVINMKNSLTSNKVLYFCMLIVIGLLSFMFFPYAFEINLIMVILGFFLICLEKEKLIANKNKPFH